VKSVLHATFHHEVKYVSVIYVGVVVSRFARWTHGGFLLGQRGGDEA
jgi:hypothetical protein